MNDNNIIGKIKFIIERQRGYFGWWNTIMLLYLTFHDKQFRWYYIPAAIIYFVVSSWVDMKYIYPSERTYGDSKSGVLMDIKNGKRGQVE